MAASPPQLIAVVRRHPVARDRVWNTTWKRTRTLCRACQRPISYRRDDIAQIHTAYVQQRLTAREVTQAYRPPRGL